MGMSFQNSLRYILNTASGLSPSSVPLVLSLLWNSAFQCPSGDVQLVTAAVLRDTSGCLAGSELVKHSGKMSLGKIFCHLLSATNIVLNQKCLNHRESNWLFHTASVPWELHLGSVLQRKKETSCSSWKSLAELPNQKLGWGESWDVGRTSWVCFAAFRLFYTPLVGWRWGPRGERRLCLGPVVMLQQHRSCLVARSPVCRELCRVPRIPFCCWQRGKHGNQTDIFNMKHESWFLLCRQVCTGELKFCRWELASPVQSSWIWDILPLFITQWQKPRGSCSVRYILIQVFLG